MNKILPIALSIVAVTLIISIFVTACYFRNSDLQFEKVCIENNKSIVYETIKGDSFARKFCK